MSVTNSRPIAVLATAALLINVVQIPNSLAQDADGQENTGRVIGTGAVTAFVGDMDRSLAFYHEAFGLDVPPLPESGARPYNPSNAQLFAMFDIPGAKERHQSATIPGADVRLEFMEIRNVPNRDLELNLQDPGALSLVFEVRDVAAALERARRAGAEVVTPGGAPVRLADGSLSVLIRDIDGRYVELRQSTSATGSGGAVVALRASVAVGNMSETLRAYRDVLGFTVVEEHSMSEDAALRRLTGLSSASFRRAVAHGPGSSLRIEFVEYRGVERKSVDRRIQDLGAARLQIRAENLEPLVETMIEAGFRVVSQGGGPVPIPPNFMGALVADPNHFFLTPFAPCNACAPRLVPESH